MKASLCVLILILLAPLCRAAPQNVQADLLSDVSAIKAGQPFTVGVLLKIEPRWHVYWKNPGDSGRATTVKFDLPPGFTAGDLRYPVPTKIVQPGDETIYGYENEVMFTATITPPKDLPAGASVPIAASVQWLVCADVCVPGKATVNLNLPVSNEAAPANTELFKSWNDRMPVPLADAGEIVKVISEDVAVAAHDRIEFKFAKPVRGVDWYPDASDDLAITRIHMAISDDGKRAIVEFDSRPLPGGSASPAVPGGLLVYTDAGRQRDRHGVIVPLQQSPSTRPIGN